MLSCRKTNQAVPRRHFNERLTDVSGKTTDTGMQMHDFKGFNDRCHTCGDPREGPLHYGHQAPVDPVNHPPHYTAHPSGVECITITEHMNFCLGNAMKYIWRADEKGRGIEDLEKARWYLDREIARRRKGVDGA